jgi:hypothetical protein
MKRKLAVFMLVVLMGVQLSACTNPLQFTCKEPGCDETDINDDGYCNVHSIEHALGDAKDSINDAIEDKAKDLLN